MEVPSQAADHIFEAELVRGSVLRTEMQFPNGMKKPKYIIVLNKIPADSTTLLFLTTSQVDFYDRHPKVDHIRIQANSLPCFPKETIIDCREVWPMDRVILKKRYQQGTLKFDAVLPAAHMEQIDRLVASSRFISLRYKKLILGWS